MAVARFGAIFALAAFVLFLLCTLSAPVINKIAFLKIEVLRQTINLGTYGICAGDTCTNKELGYRIDDLLRAVRAGDTIGGKFARGTLYAVGILNPIAAGMAFLAALFALVGGRVSHILGSIIAFFAFLVAIIALGVNLGAFVTARHLLNDNLPGSPAELGNAMWMWLAGTICLLIAALTICLGSSRDRKNKYDPAYAHTATPVTSERPSRFNFFRRNKV